MDEETYYELERDAASDMGRCLYTGRLLIVVEGCEYAEAEMLRMNPEKKIADKVCDWVCENYYDMVFDYIGKNDRGLELDDNDRNDIIEYWGKIQI